MLYLQFFTIYSMLQMLSSLRKITSLPDNTDIYCGHEYTLVCSYFLFCPWYSLLCFLCPKCRDIDSSGLECFRIIRSLHWRSNLKTRIFNPMLPMWLTFEVKACPQWVLELCFLVNLYDWSCVTIILSLLACFNPLALAFTLRVSIVWADSNHTEDGKGLQSVPPYIQWTNPEIIKHCSRSWWCRSPGYHPASKG